MVLKNLNLIWGYQNLQESVAVINNKIVNMYRLEQTGKYDNCTHTLVNTKNDEIYEKWQECDMKNSYLAFYLKS